MEVRYIDHMGTDLTVVNAARVSFDKESDWTYGTRKVSVFDDVDYPGVEEVLDYNDRRLSEQDANLIRYLSRGMSSKEYEKILWEMTGSADQEVIRACLQKMDRDPHWTPFAHCSATFVIKAPIFVRSQLFRHTVGIVANEVSRRYVDESPEFFWPDGWRLKAANVKQGSSDEIHSNNHLINNLYKEYLLAAEHVYEKLKKEGVAPELARMVLPQSTYTEWWWTGSLAAWGRICKQRLDEHAQYETQQVAKEISKHMKDLFPVSWDALLNN